MIRIACCLLILPAGLIAQSSGDDRDVSWKKLIPNILSDQKQIWLFPVHVAEGYNILPTALVLGATAGIIATDPPEANYFRNTMSFHGFNQIATSNVTAIGTALVPASLYAVGLLRRDFKMTKTALLAAEAVADAEIVSTALRGATGRLRPSSVPVTGNFADTWSEGGTGGLRTGTSFPSGHTIAAFSVATVVARRYSNHRWVPYVAYGAATLVGFSRLSLSAHFGSDVFVGAVLGFSISRFGVLR